jgi:exosortase A-associated hydrolase 1
MLLGVERPVVFSCDDRALLGVIHLPQNEAKNIGVIIVVGGPQYRVGSHRQFVLMARSLAASGYTVMRFDYGGMGDSDGEFKTFKSVDQDIDSAMITLRAECPDLVNVVLWGLCDGASAILLRCASGLSIGGVILVNPWARTDSGEAQAYLKYYYMQRLFSMAFWQKFFSGQFRILSSIIDLLSKVKVAAAQSSKMELKGVGYIERMRTGLAALQVPVLLLLSERDLTAKEFMVLCGTDPQWERLLKSDFVNIVQFPNADHTFSNGSSLDAATSVCIDWLGNVGKNKLFT